MPRLARRRALTILIFNPTALEPPRRRARVARRVLDVLVAEVVLNQTQVRHLGAVGKVIAAGVTQHLRQQVAELCTLTGLADEVGDALAGQLLAAVGTKEQCGAMLYPSKSGLPTHWSRWIKRGYPGREPFVSACEPC